MMAEYKLKTMAAWHNLQKRINALSLRERVMVLTTLLAVLFALTIYLILPPLNAKKTSLNTILLSKQMELQALQQQIVLLTAEQQRNPDAANRQHLAALRKQLAALPGPLSDPGMELVTLREMNQMVKNILTKTRGLEVISMENLAPVVLGDTATAASNGPATTPSPPPPATANSAAQAPLIYKHGMRLRVQGNYRDFVEFLRTLETLPWKVLWGEVSLEITEERETRLTLVMYTLSLQPAWLGV